LILEALKLPAEKLRKPIQNYFSLAAAVNEDSIENNRTYFHSTQKCHKIFIFHSNKDDVLRYVYWFAEEGEEALGGEEWIDLSTLPKNVRLIDCTEFVDSHSGYFKKEAFPVYEFIYNEKAGKIVDLNAVLNGKLTAKGFLEMSSELLLKRRKK
jgi:hypothetical protein